MLFKVLFKFLFEGLKGIRCFIRNRAPVKPFQVFIWILVFAFVDVDFRKLFRSGIYDDMGMKKADDVMQYNRIEWTEFTVR